MLRPNEQERAMLQRLADTRDGELFLRYCERIVAHLTNTRNLPKERDFNIEVEAANRSSDTIEECFTRPMSHSEEPGNDVEQMD